MPKITFQFENGNSITANAQPGERLLDIATNAGVAVDAPCGGNGTCGKCRMRIAEGSVSSKPSRHIKDDEYADGWRLACESTVEEDVTVAVPETASAFKTGIRTADLNDPATLKAFVDVQRDLSECGVTEQSAIFTKVLTMAEPTLDDTMPDNERIEWAANEATGLECRLSYGALLKLSRVLRENNFTVKCVFKYFKDDVLKILDVLPPEESTPVCGMAIDIGTTTVTGTLVNMETGELLAKASAGNGQIRFGADVINRIIASVRPGGSTALRKAVVDDTLIPLINSLCRDSGVPKDHIYRACIAGNTTMEHLFLGLYADPVRKEPYIPSFFYYRESRLSDIFPGLNVEGGLLLAPNVGSYVGGDITAGVLATTLWNKPELTLFVDLGTNGELVLGNSDYMFTCACSAGPAFEGGDISCGMRATNGAIEAVKIDEETMDPTLEIIGDTADQKPIGLCGSGIIDTVAELFRTNIISPKGKFIREGRRILRDENGMGRYVFAFEDESADGREVSINEVDLDNFIRAKGAIFSAILLMLNSAGMTVDDLEHVQIAGGIGGGIDFPNAKRIGMLPDIPLEKYSYIGNSSLSGAYAMLLYRDSYIKTGELAKNMTYIELSSEPTYMDEFVSACFLPHTNASLFPNA